MSAIGVGVGLAASAAGIGTLGAVGLGVAAGGANLMQQRAQRKAADRATQAQVQSTDAAIAEQRRQFDLMRETFQPYVDVGTDVLPEMRALLGIGDEQLQQQALQRIQEGPQFQAMLQQGEEAILQNAAATGGLRGGNTQASLAQFHPQLLGNEINRRFGQLGGLAQLGQASAAGVGSGALMTGQNVGNLLLEQGQAIGQGAIARGNIRANQWGQIGNLIGAGIGGFGGF